MQTITVTGAYGRRYVSGGAALADWKAGRDFVILSPGYPTYCSIRDAAYLAAEGIDRVVIRWRRASEQVSVPVAA